MLRTPISFIVETRNTIKGGKILYLLTGMLDLRFHAELLLNVRSMKGREH